MSIHETRLRLLTAFNAVVAGAMLVAFLTGSSGGAATFTELNVERINLVEKDGRVRLVIANSERSPRLMHRGEAFGREGGGRPGLIFYNDEGTENGGLTFSGGMVDGKVSAVGSLTFDQYERDQTVALQYVDESGTRRSGLAVMDYAPGTSQMALMARWDSVSAMPNGPAMAAAQREIRRLGQARPRLYAGRARDDGAALVSLSDAAGKERLRLKVDSSGLASIEFLNDSGRVLRSIAADGGAAGPR
jgi:hypothetical protein